MQRPSLYRPGLGRWEDFGDKTIDGGSGPSKRDVSNTGLLGPDNAWVHGQIQEGSQGKPFVKLGIQVNAGCEWEYDNAQCKRYPNVIVNSHDCQGVGGKHGGAVKNNCLLWWLDLNKYGS